MDWREIRLRGVPTAWHDAILLLVDTVVLPYVRKSPASRDLRLVIERYRGGAVITGQAYGAGSCVKISVYQGDEMSALICHFMAGYDGADWCIDVVRTFHHLNQRPKPKPNKGRRPGLR